MNVVKPSAAMIIRDSIMYTTYLGSILLLVIDIRLIALHFLLELL
jgi:hypothetical protein